MQPRWTAILDSARVGASIGAAALGAAFAVLLVRDAAAGTPLLAQALIATLVWWSVLNVLRIEEEAFVRQYDPLPGIVSSCSFLVAALGFVVAARFDPNHSTFYCGAAPLQRLFPAIIGAGAFGTLSALAVERAPSARLSLLVQLSTFWCAPFVGFYFGPVFLAQALVVPCSDTTLGGALATAVGVMVAGRLGISLARWLGSRPT